MTPRPLHTHTHPQVLCNLVHSAMKSMHTHKYTLHTALQFHSHCGSEEADPVVVYISPLITSFTARNYINMAFVGAFVLSDQPNPFTASHSLTKAG